MRTQEAQGAAAVLGRHGQRSAGMDAAGEIGLAHLDAKEGAKPGKAGRGHHLFVEDYQKPRRIEGARDFRHDHGIVAARGDYAVIVPKIARAFDPARLLVIFYEEMMTAPGFARLCAFLGIEVREADFARRVHAGAALAMTPEDRRRALRFLRPQYEFAATRFPALPDAWRSAMSEAL